MAKAKTKKRRKLTQVAFQPKGGSTTYRVVLFTGRGRQPHYFRLEHKNGKAIATSEGYASKQGRSKTARTLAKHSGLAVFQEEK